MKEKLIEISKNIFCGYSKKDIKTHNQNIDEIDKIFKNIIKEDIEFAKSLATELLCNKENRVKYIGATYSIQLRINRIKTKLTLLKMYYFEQDPSLGMAAYILLEDCKQKTKQK